MINKLLRRYLKFKRLPEFDRLASYASLWGVCDDQTYVLLALRAYRVGKNGPDETQLCKIKCDTKRSQIKQHIESFTTSKEAVTAGLIRLQFNPSV